MIRDTVYSSSVCVVYPDASRILQGLERGGL